MPDKMSQAEFIKRLKEQLPQLKDFSDFDIMNGIVKRRPDVLAKVETPNQERARNDVANARGQAAAERSSHFISYVDPAVWDKHPNLAGWSKGALNTLPGIGTIVGGALATPETMGLGTAMGGILGTGVGTGLKDYISELAGLNHTTGLQKIGNIGKDEAIATLLPGAIDRVFHPIQAARDAVGMVNNAPSMLVPKGFAWMKPFLKNDALDTFAQGGKPGLNKLGSTLVKPPWQTGEQTFPSSVEYTPSSGLPRDLRPGESVTPPFKTKFESINEAGRQFRPKLPADTDLGFRPATSEQPQLPFGESPSGEWMGPSSAKPDVSFKEGDLPLGDPTWKVYRGAKGKNSVTISEPTPFKVAEAKANGFTVEGTPNENGELVMSKPESPIQPIPNAKNDGSVKVEPIPNARGPEEMSTDGLNTKDIIKLYGEGWKPKKGDPTTLVRAEVKGQAGGKTGPDIAGDTGIPPGMGPSEDWKQTYMNLRKMLGRDPSAAEIDAAQARSGSKQLGTNIQSSQYPTDDYHVALKNLEEAYAQGHVVDFEDELANLNERYGVIDTMSKETQKYVDQMRGALDEGYMGLHPDSPHLPNMLKSGAKVVDKLDDGTLILDHTGQGSRVTPVHPDAPKRFGQGRGVLPGESTGNVAPFENRSNDEILIRRTTDPTELKNLDNHWYAERVKAINAGDDAAIQHATQMHERVMAQLNELAHASREASRYGIPSDAELEASRRGLQLEDEQDIRNGIDPNKHPTGPIPSDEELNNPQNDVLGVRTRNTLGPREITPADTPVQPRMGQQDLPLGPQGGRPPVDEYGIPQNRDWSPEDIFRINSEMKNMSPVPPKPQIPEPQQMNIPEIGDDAIQRYLQQEDATPPEMVDLPKHSPDKISFMQKLKDMLDQEEYA